MAVDRFSYNIPLYLSGSSQGGEFVGSTEGLEGVTHVLRKPRGTFLLGLLQIIPTVCADATELTALMSASSNTNVRVTFSAPVFNNVALLNTGSYVFVPSIIVSTVTPEAITNPNYVDLTVSGMSRITYGFDIKTIEAA